MEGLNWVSHSMSWVTAILLLLQVVSVAAVWTIGTVGQEGANLFALFVAINLVSFALISYIYRMGKGGRVANEGYLLAGLGLLFLLFLVVFFA